jgi:hypothetical protein
MIVSYVSWVIIRELSQLKSFVYYVLNNVLNVYLYLIVQVARFHTIFNHLLQNAYHVSIFIKTVLFVIKILASNVIKVIK